MPAPLAYFITWTTYGTWLQGDERGSVIGRGSAQTPFSKPRRGIAQRGYQQLKHDPVLLNHAQRCSVQSTISAHCNHREWALHAIAVRTNHVHAVVSGSATPEVMMTQFKAWATRRLREAHLIDEGSKVWTTHGSTRHLNSEASVEGATRYLKHGQGKPLD